MMTFNSVLRLAAILSYSACSSIACPKTLLFVALGRPTRDEAEKRC